MPSSARSLQHDVPVPSSAAPIGLTLVSRSPHTRASNAARAALVVANVTPTGYRVGIFMANHAALRHGSRRPAERVPGGNLLLLAAGQGRSRSRL